MENRISELENVIALDLETTGLDEQNDQILEIYAKPGRIVAGRFETHANGGWDGIQIVLPIEIDPRLWHPTVIDMHTKNGLLTEAHGLLQEAQKSVRSEHSLSSELYDWRDRADRKLAATFPKRDNGAAWTLLGQSVHFDLRFVRRVFPRFAKHLSHRVIDVSSIRMFCETLGLPYAKDEPVHRARQDVEASIAAFERYAAFTEVGLGG